MKLLALLLVFVGCSWLPGSVKPMPSDLTQARDAVWQFYGHPPGELSPYVLVVTNLTCRNSPGDEMVGFGVVGVRTDGTCLSGIEPTPLFVAIARIGAQPWHETSLAHELMHADQNTRGIVDNAHTRVEDWEGGKVGAANVMLAGRGM